MTHSLIAPVHDARTVASLLGITYTKAALRVLGPTPDPLDGFVTFFDPGWSILRLRAATEDRGRIFYPQDWYDREPFALSGDTPRHRQVRMQPTPGSLSKTYAEQLSLLLADEEVPTARVVVSALVIHFLAAGERLLPDAYARSASQSSRGNRVCVGLFDASGLGIDCAWGDHRRGSLAMASARQI